jgi:integron integrase
MDSQGPPFPSDVERYFDALRLTAVPTKSHHDYLRWVQDFRQWQTRSSAPSFLPPLNNEGNLAAATQDQAMHAILFLYHQLLDRPLLRVGKIDRAKKPQRLPVVLSRAEVKTILAHLSGVERLVVELLYGAGFRLKEALRLRIKDVDFDTGQLIVRDAKGAKDRIAILPNRQREPLRAQIQYARALHERDLQQGGGSVYLPYALARKYPNAATEWKWQYIFPSSTISKDPRSDRRGRHHLGKGRIERAVREVVIKAEIPKHATPHTFRH